MVLSIAIVHSRDMKFNSILLLTYLLFKKNLCEIVRDKKPLSKVKKNSIDVELSKKFQFQLFENFYECKDLYTQEKYVVSKLVEVKQELLKAKAKLTCFLNASDRKDSEDVLFDFSKNIFSTLQFINEFLEVETNEYPTESDMNGSIKALYILHYSYYLNLTAAVQDGKLKYKDHHGMLREYQAYEKLHLKDILMLADKALETRDYALAIDLTRAIIPMVKQNQGRGVTAVCVQKC